VIDAAAEKITTSLATSGGHKKVLFYLKKSKSPVLNFNHELRRISHIAIRSSHLHISIFLALC
jgi:hypothetical protein